MRTFWVALVIGMVTWGSLGAKEGPQENAPYIQSRSGGGDYYNVRAYARCVPASDFGSEGTTTIYNVGKEADTLVAKYPWYCRDGVRFMASPLGGKICVMRAATDLIDPADPDGHVEFSFFVEGELVRSVTAGELKAMGGKTDIGHHNQRFQVISFEFGDAEQVPTTNDYDFIIRLRDGTHLKFDILTGKNIRSPVKRRLVIESSLAETKDE